MSTILIRPNYEKNSAAIEVYNALKEKIDVDEELICGYSSSNGLRNPIKSFIRYITLLGPFLSFKSTFTIIRKVKNHKNIILDTSHFNLLIPILILNGKKVSIVYHNNEFIFLLEELKYLQKKRRIFQFLVKLNKLPYTLIIRYLEKIFDIELILISTIDLQYRGSNRVKFLDILPPLKFTPPFTANLDPNLIGYIGSKFYNNYAQIEDLLNSNQEIVIYGYGKLKINDSRYIHCGLYKNECELSSKYYYYLGENNTGFPTKFKSYQKINGVKVISKYFHSLNIMDKPNFNFLKSI